MMQFELTPQALISDSQLWAQGISDGMILDRVLLDRRHSQPLFAVLDMPCAPW
jgi:hypothetical protein